MEFTRMWIAFVTIILFVPTTSQPAANKPNVHTSPRTPHILLVIADDLGWNDVGYHGSEIRTPIIDKLSESGVRLENYYVQQYCSPSRSALLTGRYPIHNGMQHYTFENQKAEALPTDSPLLPEKLRDAGYTTHLVGKWHLGFYKEKFTPTYRGYDSFYGFYVGRQGYYGHNTCDVESSELHFINRHKKQTEPGIPCGYDFRNNTDVNWGALGKYSTFLFAEEAERIVSNHNPDKLKTMESIAALKDGGYLQSACMGEPLYLQLAFQAGHKPLIVPKSYVQQYQFIQDQNRRTYAGMVTCMDEAIGNVTDAFKKYGFWQDTLMIFISDNGADPEFGGSNFPLRGGKSNLFEGGIRVPAFVHYPPIAQGRLHRELIHISDWFPTVIKLVGGDLNGTKHLDGYDQWQTISKGLPSPRAEILHNIDPLTRVQVRARRDHAFDTRVQAAIRVGAWKLVTGIESDMIRSGRETSYANLDSINENQNHVKTHGLFNIEHDPVERVDLSDKYPNIVKYLLDRLHYYNSSAVPPQTPPDDPRSNPALHGGVWEPWL